MPRELTAREKQMRAAALAAANPAAVPAEVVARYTEQPTNRECYFECLLKAPFRFVALDNRVAWAESGEIVPHDKPLPEGLCATVRVDWVAETPLLIGAARPEEGGIQTVGPLKLGDEYVVPGASLKGMLRAALEIVAFGRLHPVNRHHDYGLRDFDHPDYRAVTDGGTGGLYPISKVAEVKAGWLYRHGPDDDPRHELRPCGWAQVMVEGFVPDAKWKWAGATSLEKKYELTGGASKYDFSRTCQFSKIADRNGKMTVELVPQGDIEGVLVFADKVPIPPPPKKQNGQSETDFRLKLAEYEEKQAALWEKSGKKVEYVFYGPEGEPVMLDKKAFAAFELIHSKPSRNKREPDGSWAKLLPTLKGGKRIPVFYVGDPSGRDGNQPFAMGLTRLFKVPHRHSVGAVADRSGEHRHLPVFHRPDRKAEPKRVEFVENLFGYVLEGGEDSEFCFLGPEPPKAVARKGRVAFSFGRFAEQPTEEPSVATVMMGPRASFAPFYLRGAVKDWSDDKATLSGRKRYLPRYPAERLNSAKQGIDERFNAQVTEKTKNNKKIQTSLKFLKPKDGAELRFSSTIRLHNVTEAELGALLWVLTHGGRTDKYRHMLGRAKAFGAGQLRVDKACLRVTPNGNPRIDNADHQPYLKAFKELMAAKVGADWKTSKSMLEYLACCDPAQGAALEEAGKLDYLREPGMEFGQVRKMAKPMAKTPKTDKGPPCFPDRWGGRYLETPKDED